MFRYRPLPSYLLLVTVILATSRRGASLCPQDQSAALLRLKASFRFVHYSYSRLPSWKADNTNCCTWEGVTCDGTSGYVIALDLSRHNILGNLSSSDIFELTSLRFLSLAYNNFDASPWPSPGFEQLKDLKYLDLSYSGLSGDLPIENGQLSNLVTLNLSSLHIKDLNLETLIVSLGSLQTLRLDLVNISVSSTNLAHASSTNKASGLQELSMQESTVTGRIDIVLELLAESSSLVFLQLKLCTLTGTFPSKIFLIESLTVLDVSGNDNLYGELPEFIPGSALKLLNLAGTKFSGKIPESIGNLQNLTILDLSSCQFHGPIPSFAEWLKIQEINLSNNNLTGKLHPDNLALCNLTSLYLANNSITGEIPASLFSQHSLKYLDLSQNNFIGKFRLYPHKSSGLTWIDISNNKLQGPIPNSLSKLVGLEVLDISSNNFTGTVDLSLFKNYEQIGYLSLSNNRLSVVEKGGNRSFPEYQGIWSLGFFENIWSLGLASCNLSYVPKFLMHLRNVYYLDVSNNNIGGHIPDWIWGIGPSDGISLNLSHNLITSIDTNLSNRSIHNLDIHSNKIGGDLPLPPPGIDQLDYSNNHFNTSIMPEFWSSVNSAEFLSLANNSITGELSHFICDATYIQVLDLSFNSFSGLIPPCLLTHNKYLEILNLRGNNFRGSLPQDINKGCALQKLDINGNKLEGKLPVSMINCHMLQVLDLGNNRIVDEFPEWLGVLRLLKVLVLRSNRFYGPIHHYGMNKQRGSSFPELQVLDLSSNSLSGRIPTRFLKQFKAMMVSSGAPSMYVGIIGTSASPPSPMPTLDGRKSPMPYYYYDNSVTVTLKGQETTLVQILSVFMSLDLSNNNFQGFIPSEIGDLKFLKVLNLSRNSFTGRIPPKIANMLQLESLDLSCNQLSGEIPPAMALMSFLEVLNLSYNHLSGMIPQSSQFSTFQETSFLGNVGLCGKPLPRLCDTNHTPSAAATPGSSKELNWEFLSIEAGVVSGLVIVFVTTLLWGNGRRWVYWQVDKFLLNVLQPWIRGRLK